MLYLIVIRLGLSIRSAFIKAKLLGGTLDIIVNFKYGLIDASYEYEKNSQTFAETDGYIDRRCKKGLLSLCE